MMTPDDPRHGTWRGYCAHHAAKQKPCEPCAAAARRYDGELRLEKLRGMPSRRVPGVGTARRVQALIALGWSHHQLAARLGVSHDMPAKWARAGGSFVMRRTADRVDAVFRELCMTPPPEDTTRLRREAAYARTLARKRGWVTALAWDDIDDPDEQPASVVRDAGAVDPVVVERILAGDWHLPATRAERVEVCRQWTGGRNELGRLTGWKVDRYITGEAVAA